MTIKEINKRLNNLQYKFFQICSVTRCVSDSYPDALYEFNGTNFDSICMSLTFLADVMAEMESELSNLSDSLDREVRKLG